MTVNLEGKVVVVTGASRGIGREICAGFAANGAQVIGVASSDLTETGAYLANLKTRHAKFQWHAVNIDLASPASIQEGCQKIQKQFPAVDVLVNNGALYGGLKLTPMEAIDLDLWERVFNINVRGTYLMIRELLPALKTTKGKVINFASTSMLAGSPFLLHYVSSKGAVIGMTYALATELGMYGIRVNAITPGLIGTPSSQGIVEGQPQIVEAAVQAQAIKELLQADDVVGTVLYLASAWGDAVTGQLIVVDRGMIKH